MARSGIRYQDVKDAAETLLGRGLNPTIQRIRELLGTGSNTTISDHLKSWQQQLADTPKAVLPPTVPEAVMAALDAFWTIAVQYAEAAFTEQRDRARQAVTDAEQLRDAALAAQQQAQDQAAELGQQLETTQAAGRDLADRLLVEQERRAVAENAIQAAEQRVEAATQTVGHIRAETTARIAQVDAALQQARTDLAQQAAAAQRRFDAERQRGEASEVQWMQRLDRERSERSAERQKLLIERQDGLQREAALKQELAQVQREQSATSQQLGSVKESLSRLSTERAEACAAVEQYEKQYRATAHALEIAQMRLDAEVARCRQLEQNNGEWRRLLLLLPDVLPKPGDSPTS